MVQSLLEKLTGLQLVKKFPSFHGTRRFITALTSVRHLSLSWASLIQSIYPHPTSWRSNLILSTHLRLGLTSVLFPSGFPTKNLYTPLSSPIRATCPAHLLLDFWIGYTAIISKQEPHTCRRGWYLGRGLCVICVGEYVGKNLSSMTGTGWIVSTYGDAEEIRNKFKTNESCWGRRNEWRRKDSTGLGKVLRTRKRERTKEEKINRRNDV